MLVCLGTRLAVAETGMDVGAVEKIVGGGGHRGGCRSGRERKLVVGGDRTGCRCKREESWWWGAVYIDGPEGSTCTAPCAGSVRGHELLHVIIIHVRGVHITPISWFKSDCSTLVAPDYDSGTCF